MIPMTDGEYQTKIKAAVRTADAPDVVALEAAFVKEWVEADLLADLNESAPPDRRTARPSRLRLRQLVQWRYKRLLLPGHSGAFEYRRSIAKECLGTDDPAEVQAMVADMDKFVETAAKIKECNPNYFMVGTSGALFNPFLANRSQPWIVDDTLVIDPMVDRVC